jgi:hypothetical protein
MRVPKRESELGTGLVRELLRTYHLMLMVLALSAWPSPRTHSAVGPPIRSLAAEITVLAT